MQLAIILTAPGIELELRVMSPTWYTFHKRFTKKLVQPQVPYDYLVNDLNPQLPIYACATKHSDSFLLKKLSL